MKRLLVMFCFIFGLIFNLSAQQKEYKVYETENGIKKVVPSQKVVVDGNTTKVYSYKNGVRKINPDKIFIKSSDRKIKEYKVNSSGVKELQPTTVIKKKDKKESSGNWW